MTSNEVNLNIEYIQNHYGTIVQHTGLGNNSLGTGHTFIPVWAMNLWIFDIWPTGSIYTGKIFFISIGM